MTKAVIGILIAVIVVMVVGFMLWRSTTPAEAPAPTGTPVLQDISNGTPNLFLQVSPSSSPAVSGSPSPSASSSPTASLRPIPTATRISISDTGFSPATITVPAGSTVTFVNNGQANHWPASDPHPTHTGLPGFDSKRALATGEEYSFMFDKMGTWGYHDHLFPQLKGQVVVQ